MKQIPTLDYETFVSLLSKAMFDPSNSDRTKRLHDQLGVSSNKAVISILDDLYRRANFNRLNEVLENIADNDMLRHYVAGNPKWMYCPDTVLIRHLPIGTPHWSLLSAQEKEAITNALFGYMQIAIDRSTRYTDRVSIYYLKLRLIIALSITNDYDIDSTIKDVLGGIEHLI